jgi:putative addiction module component (TIGR02574 family)
MDLHTTLTEISALSVDERVRLVQAIWDTIEPETIALTAADEAEIERRLSAHSEHPDRVVPWDEVKAAALARARK